MVPRSVVLACLVALVISGPSHARSSFHVSVGVGGGIGGVGIGYHRHGHHGRVGFGVGINVAPVVVHRPVAVPAPVVVVPSPVIRPVAVCRRTWIPGHHEIRYVTVKSPGYYRTVWVPPAWEVVYDHGTAYRRLVRAGYHKKEWVPATVSRVRKKVWVAGHYAAF